MPKLKESTPDKLIDHLIEAVPAPTERAAAKLAGSW